MSLLIHDFLKRWRWMLAVLALLTIFTGWLGFPMTLGPVAAVFLVRDRIQGVFAVAGRLPVSRRERIATWWGIGVILPPLLWIAPLAISAWIYETAGPLSSKFSMVLEFFGIGQRLSPWFVILVQTWVGLGFCALLFVIARFLPSRIPSGTRDTVAANVSVGFLVLALWSMLFLLLMPRSQEELRPWHWSVFAAVPALVALSLLCARRFADVRPRGLTDVQKPRRYEESVGSQKGLQGIPLFLATFLPRVLGPILLLDAFQLILVPRWYGADLPPPPTFIVVLTVMLGATSLDLLNARTLRVLPVSTAKLAALLLSAPVAAAFAGAEGAFSWGTSLNGGNGAVETFLSYWLCFAGFAVLALGIHLRIASLARFFLPVLITVIPAIALIFVRSHSSLWLAVGGAITFVPGFFLVWNGLRRSGSVYAPRQIAGPQPSM